MNQEIDIVMRGRTHEQACFEAMHCNMGECQQR